MYNMSLFKYWAETQVKDHWSPELEKFVASKKPSNHTELETAIREYEEMVAKKAAKTQTHTKGETK